MIRKQRRLAFFAGLILVILSLVLFFAYKLPKFQYSLLQSKTNEEAQHPLIVTVYGDTVKLELSIIGRVGEFDKVKLQKRIILTNTFPFFDIDRSLVLRFIDKDNESKKSQTLYSFIGYINNLRKKEYRIRVEDTYKNLIDEVVLSLDTVSEDILDIGFCESASDCTPVGCGCTCSGCGGFSYEDVVNNNYVDSWYDDHSCSPATACPQVCCPARQVICKDNRCEVVELGEL